MTAVKFKDPLQCPECAALMHEVYTEANYGRVIIVDQCKRCGGVWFDRWELYFLTDESLKTLEHVDAAAFIAPSAPLKKSGHECPRCSVELVAFLDPMLPKDADIKRCAGCHGLWLNRGAIGKYKSRRQEIRGAIVGEVTETAQGAVQKNAAAGARVEMLKKLQKELDVKSLAYERQAEPEAPIKPKEFAADMGILALDALLSMVFKI